MALITEAQLAQIMPRSKASSRTTFLAPLNMAMAEFEINTPPRIAAFLAQVAHESGSLRYVEEIASGSNYEFRKDLGNLEFEALQAAHANYTTTGKWYKGRGLIQCTGLTNYKACGEALGVDLVNNPRLLTEPDYAARSAAWFWHKNNLNRLADIGAFSRISRIINGGTNGKEDRERFYAAAKEVLMG